LFLTGDYKLLQKQVLRFKSQKSIFSLLFIILLFLSNFSFLLVQGDETAAINVVFDESHNPIFYSEMVDIPFVSGAYKEFAELLENNSYNVDTFNNTLLYYVEETFDEVDILILSCPSKAYMPGDFTYIEQWVHKGGSLFVITDYGPYGNAVSGLLEKFGYAEKGDDIKDSDDNLTSTSQTKFYVDGSNLHSHPALGAVSRVEFTSPDGLIEIPDDSVSLITTDNDGTAYWGDTGISANNVTILSVLEGGLAKKGKVVVFTDANPWNNWYDTDNDTIIDFFDADHAELALNLINWLAIKSTQGFPIRNIYLSIFITFSCLAIITKRKKK